MRGGGGGGGSGPGERAAGQLRRKPRGGERPSPAPPLPSPGVLPGPRRRGGVGAVPEAAPPGDTGRG